MKARVIISATERKTSPWFAAVISLAVTGLGQVYAGAPLTGAIFILLRTMTILAAPFYSLKNTGEYMAEEIFFSLFASLLISIMSPIHAYFAVRKKQGVLAWYNSVFFYSAFTAGGIFLTALSIMVFFTFFNIQKVHEDTPPLFKKGDFIAVKKPAPAGYMHGDIVLTGTSSGNKILRIIGVPGETVSYSRGRFISDSSELPLSIFSEEELRLFYLTDYDVISELNGSVRYPVSGRSMEKIPDTPLASGEYFLAPDSRESSSLFIKTDVSIIRGRVEGILLSRDKALLPGKITLPADNSFSGR